jgi:WD40 repeat protein
MILGEIVPRQARPCNVVQFNAWNPTQLLVGLDKVRNDYCLFVHDIGHAAGLVTSKTPLFQFGSSETIDSAIFFNSGNRIVAGMGSKWLRLYDLKRPSGSSNAPSIVFGTRSVLGVEADPFNENYFLSHAEDSVVNIWDIRNNKGPCLVLETDFHSAIRTVTYNPHISGLLAVCGENERYIILSYYTE